MKKNLLSFAAIALAITCLGTLVSRADILVFNTLDGYTATPGTGYISPVKPGELIAQQFKTGPTVTGLTQVSISINLFQSTGTDMTVTLWGNGTNTATADDSTIDWPVTALATLYSGHVPTTGEDPLPEAYNLVIPVSASLAIAPDTFYWISVDNTTTGVDASNSLICWNYLAEDLAPQGEVSQPIIGAAAYGTTREIYTTNAQMMKIDAVPELSSLLILVLGGAILGGASLRRQRMS